jgi:dipeptidyl aminopeptidase/acylaminoacyl peptidase
MKKNLKKMIWMAAFLFFQGLFGTGVCQTSRVLPSFQDLISLEVPFSPLISPKGCAIIYSVRQTLWEKNQFQSKIWLVDVLHKKSDPMKKIGSSGYQAKWSPDGSFISFLSISGEECQIRLVTPQGGECKTIASCHMGIIDYEWSPNKNYIAYLAPDEKNSKRTELEKKYGRFEIVDEGFDVCHLLLLETETGEVKKLVYREDLNIKRMNWSPDSTKIVFSATPDPLAISSSKSDLYMVDIKNQEVIPLVKQFGPDNNPVWSPDCRTIAFTSSPGTEAYFATVDIFIVPAGGGSSKCLTKDFDEDVSIVAWKNKGIFFTARQGMTRHLFRLNPKTLQIKQITTGNDFELDSVSLTSDGEKMALITHNSQKIKELYVSTVEPFKPKQLTQFSDQIKGWMLSHKEVIHWKSTDGLDITGVLSTPADFDKKKKYPLFVFIHSGPESTSVPYKIDPWNRYYPLIHLVSKGAIILEPNYRGSAGFGENFRKLNYRNLGLGSYQDIISGVDYLISKGFVDRNRIAAFGWSQGGYISAFIACFSDRFKAVSAGGVTADWETYFFTSDLPDSTIHYLGATPWEDPEIYKKTSPITYINKARTPILIQNGEFDRRVPVANAFQLYRALKTKGVPTKLVIYKGCGHGIPRPKENLAVVTHNWEWFKKYIWNH